MTTEMTLNEYVHELDRIELSISSRGECIIVYEPLENLPCNHIMGEIYVGNPGRTPSPFGCFVGHNNQIVPDIGSFRGQNSVHGTFDRRSGCIRLRWHKYPGEHVLRVSYDFGEGVEELLRGEAGSLLMPNWLQEGF